MVKKAHKFIMQKIQKKVFKQAIILLIVLLQLCGKKICVEAQSNKSVAKSINNAPDGFPHGIVSSWAGAITKKRQWEKYPYINAVMLDENMEWWKPKGNTYTFNWSTIDSDINYLLSLNRKFAFHVNYDYPHGFGYSPDTRQGADWIYDQIAAAGAPYQGIGGARPRGQYPAWYWHRGSNWPWKQMYGWLIKEEAYHLRTTFPGQCIYVRGQFNAVDPENMSSAGAKDVAMATNSISDYAAWCAKTFWLAFMTEDTEFWKDRDVSKLTKANRIQVMFKPKEGVEKMMEQYKFGVFLTHGSPDPDQYELFEEFCRNKKLPGADETAGYPEMSNPQMFYDQQWYHLMALHSGFTTVAMRPGQITIPDNPGVSDEIKTHFKESISFVNKYLGYIHYPKQSPGAWIAFREPDRKNSYTGSNAGNWNFHITQVGTSCEINKQSPGQNNIGDLFYGLYTRQVVEPILLNVNDLLFGGEGNPVKILITAFAKDTPAVLKLMWHAGNKSETKVLNFNETNAWTTETINVTNISFNQAEDLKIESISGKAYIHMVEILKQETKIARQN